MEMSDLSCDYGLNHLGLDHLETVYWNLPSPALYEHAVRRYEAHISHLGPLVVRMGQHTGRAAKDKFVVDEPATSGDIWWGKVNVKYSIDHFDTLHRRMCAYLRGKEVFVQDCYAGADERYRLPVRVVNELAWHNLFARNMFLRQTPDSAQYKNFRPEFTVLQCPNFHADPELDATRSGTFVALNIAKRLILIGGTAYAGEIKKSIFTAMNFLLPGRGILSMHCSANVGRDDPDNVAIFFGLSGTGKTTLSASPKRMLIGDDEHGWSEDGVFNFEGGCYAKVIRLSRDSEPEIYACTRRFGTILENVAFNPASRRVDLDDAAITENTRASYPITHIPNIMPSGMAGHPKDVIMLTADAFGVLPPVAKLSPDQAMYHFISGYTAKVAGTEAGVTEPTAAFSACFGAPFMARHPGVYAELLAEKLRKHKANCWLVNTGWSGGSYGSGSRMKIEYTRALVDAIHAGDLADAPTTRDPYFGFEVPTTCPNVPKEILIPKNAWKDKTAFDATVKKLAGLFRANFKTFEGGVSQAVRNAGPSETPATPVPAMA